MNRAEKEAAVAELAEQITESEAIFAINYRGISVSQSAELRGKLRESDASFRVSKNRLVKLAAAKAGQEGLDDVLVGPTALTFVKGDTAAAAKAITTFGSKHDLLEFKGGVLGGTLLDEERFKAIARLPSREMLNAQLAGTIASPLTGLVRGLGSMVSGLAIALGQIAEQGLVGQDAPAADSAASPSEESSAGETAESTPEGSGSEAEQPSADETPNPDSEPSASDSSDSNPEGESEAAPSEESPETEPAESEPSKDEPEPEPEAESDKG